MKNIKSLVVRFAVFAAVAVSCQNVQAFQVSWNGSPLAVHPARVSAVPMNQVWAGYQRPVEQTRMAAFVSFDMTGPGEFAVTPDATEEAGEPVLLPLSYLPETRRENGTLFVRIDRPRPFTLSFGREGATLHVFANPPFVAPTGANVRRFGPGEHHVGLIAPKSGETVVIDEGAVVYGSIFIAHAHDVRVCGRGIVDGSYLDRADRGCAAYRAAVAAGFEPGPYGAEMAVTDFTCAWSTNVTVEGVTFRNPPRWTMIVRAQSKNVTIDNVKIVGCWRYNSDGINVCASEDVTVRNSFVRSFDDCIIARGAYLDGGIGPTRDVLVEKCVLWCDWGKNLEVWAGHRPCLIENVTYRDLALVQTSHVPCDVTTWFASPDTRIRDVTVEDIEVDYPWPVASSHFQKGRDDAKYRGGVRKDQSLVRVDVANYGRYLGNQHHEPAKDLSGFRVRYGNLAFRNFRILGEPPALKAVVDATTAPHAVDGVTFENMPESVEISVRGDVTGKRIVPALSDAEANGATEMNRTATEPTARIADAIAKGLFPTSKVGGDVTGNRRREKKYD